jgi:hypothetical protein
MKRTYNFKLPYLEQGDYLYESDELQRWKGIDSNLNAITRLNGELTTGNGVISGCNISTDDTNKLISVATGTLLINGVFCISGVATLSLVTGNIYTIYGEVINIPSTSNYALTATINASIIASSLSNTACEVAKVYIY